MWSLTVPPYNLPTSHRKLRNYIFTAQCQQFILIENIYNETTVKGFFVLDSNPLTG